MHSNLLLFYSIIFNIQLYAILFNHFQYPTLILYYFNAFQSAVLIFLCFVSSVAIPGLSSQQEATRELTDEGDDSRGLAQLVGRSTGVVAKLTLLDTQDSQGCVCVLISRGKLGDSANVRDWLIDCILIVCDWFI